jgi:uncharacterized protein YbjT (DUF2867 family)
MSKRILLTGATGTVASSLTHRLVERGHFVRALVRNPEKAAAPREAGAELAKGDFDNENTMRAAFDGIDTAFLLVPPSPDAAKWNRALYAAARAAKSPHVVRLSVIKSAVDGPTDNTKLHGESDRDLVASGLPYTILRPHFFMQNLLASVPTIAKEGAFYLGMGRGRLGMIDTRDITDVAFAVLDADRERHLGKAYDLTGPASIDFDEVAATLSKVLGSAVKYVAVPPEAVVQAMKSMGASDWFARVMGQYSKAYSENWGDVTTGEVKALTGHEPRSFETFAREVLMPMIRAARERGG